MYNNRTHTDREKTPFELMYGSTPKAIIEPYLEKEEPTKDRTKKLKQWRTDALLAHKYTRQKMKQKIQSTYHFFKKGDRVWLEGINLQLGLHKKITTKREGSFVITEVCRPVNFQL